MAGFIGALAEFGEPMKCTGMCFVDATSYLSVSHPQRRQRRHRVLLII